MIRAFLKTGLWTLIVATLVIGRIIDDPTNQEIEDDAALTKEQVTEWTQEFFKSSNPASFLEHSGDRTGRGASIGISTGTVEYYRSGGGLATVKSENLEWMLRNIFTYPRSYSTNTTAKEIVKKYIAESFELTSGLPTTLQYFKPQQFLSVYDDGDIPIGANIIAILKGTAWATPQDQPIVIGAHWDTVNFSPGTDDNGSGVSAMLEAARTLAHSGCTPKHSTIFVAFDLEETGSQGSLVFIKEFLVDLLTSSGLTKEMSLKHFQGALILDSILNFNDTEGSQTFPTDWSLILPNVYDTVANDDYRGNFMSVIHRKVDKDLASTFVRYWVSAPEKRFKIRPFPLSLQEDLPDIETLSNHLNFLRSDHARFWYMNDTDIPVTLKAVLITDTGPYRGNMVECYHAVCDGPEISVYDNPTNIQFLTKATQALVDTLVDMSECAGVTGTTSQRQTVGSSASARSDSAFYMFSKLMKWFQA